MTPLATGDQPYPPALMTLAAIYDFGDGFDWSTDAEKMKSLGGIYVTRCPGSLEAEGLYIAGRLDSSVALKAYVTALRNGITGKAEPAMLAYYRTLWKLEGKLAPPQEGAMVRARIADDVTFLNGLDERTFPGAADAAALGASRVSGNAVVDVANIGSVLGDWQKTNPRPKGEAGHQAMQEWQRKRLAVIDNWRAQNPGQPNAGNKDRLRALAALDGIPPETLLREGKKLLEIGPSNAAVVAKAWAAQGVALDEVPLVVRQDLEYCERSAALWDSDLHRGSFWAELGRFDGMFPCRADDWDVLASAYEKSGKLDDARAVLGRWQQQLSELKRLADDARRRAAAVPAGAPNRLPPVARNLPDEVPGAERQYGAAMARLAVAEGRKPDALFWYQTSLKGTPIAEADADLVDEIATFWKELGGTKEAFHMWLAGEKTPDTSSGPNPSTTWE
jgi:hypothetical protein